MRRTLQRLRDFASGVFANWLPGRQQQEIDGLYLLLYHIVHDREHSPDVFAFQTQTAFQKQWEKLKDGRYLLSDPWFKDNVTRILCEEEILIKPEWFRGKEVLDAGCGNGRWSYGFAQLGAHLTAADVNEVAVQETRAATAECRVPIEFVVTPLERLTQAFPPGRKFDLVFCWGVAHHCTSFNQVVRELTKLVKENGILYLYLYGRESLSFEQDLRLFKERIRYNVLPTEQEKYHFLLAKAKGDPAKVHELHDIYAPLINRRFTFDQVRELLEEQGLNSVTRTIEHTELFVRAFKGDAARFAPWTLPKAMPPFWFQHHDR
jgi:2-polyprenyl-3-methyl-5-hydroxy-6-metoxy-1,4-benzoquinol methylase